MTHWAPLPALLGRCRVESSPNAASLGWILSKLKDSQPRERLGRSHLAEDRSVTEDMVDPVRVSIERHRRAGHAQVQQIANVADETLDRPLSSSIRTRLPWLRVNLGTTFLAADHRAEDSGGGMRLLSGGNPQRSRRSELSSRLPPPERPGTAYWCFQRRGRRSPGPCEANPVGVVEEARSLHRAAQPVRIEEIHGSSLYPVVEGLGLVRAAARAAEGSSDDGKVGMLHWLSAVLYGGVGWRLRNSRRTRSASRPWACGSRRAAR